MGLTTKMEVGVEVGLLYAILNNYIYDLKCHMSN
jgi:hypothetical protein